MKNIIIYGGAFNPPTIAHQAVLQQLAGYAEHIQAEIWLMLSGNRKDKQITANIQQRLDLARALAASVSTSVKIVIKTDELYRVKPTETYDTALELKKEYPDINFIWVFGTDSLNTILDWRHGRWLLNHLSFILVNRVGYKCLNRPKKLLHTIDIGNIKVSSTEVRQRMIDGQPIAHLVPEAVMNLGSSS
ncbi:nicotinate-nicotinamide nucleotide adenylyltransferase [Candidatus Saccharibacteria bacterium]|nr:nicotinate-nicotinamide nucleotide adenylyltransferase [Candidatus Saccharibacteria bacterium]MCB9821583.1 nicotinate-nicotinamide nucleotide adenylyltransferase [Candidatus Nomurabacteria bacterium]